MKNPQVGAELFHADWRTDGQTDKQTWQTDRQTDRHDRQTWQTDMTDRQTDRRDMTVNAILQTCLKLTECLMLMITSWLEVYYCVQCLVVSGDGVGFD